MNTELDDFIDRVLSYKTWTDKRKIDALLEYDCSMYTNLGKEYLWHMDK